MTFWYGPRMRIRILGSVPFWGQFLPSWIRIRSSDLYVTFCIFGIAVFKKNCSKRKESDSEISGFRSEILGVGSVVRTWFSSVEVAWRVGRGLARRMGGCSSSSSPLLGVAGMGAGLRGTQAARPPSTLPPAHSHNSTSTRGWDLVE